MCAEVNTLQVLMYKRIGNEKSKTQSVDNLVYNIQYIIYMEECIYRDMYTIYICI